MEVRSPFTGRRGVCLPFSDACEPLVFDPEVIELVKDRLIRFAQERRWRYLEIRGGKFFRLASNSVPQFYGHRLDLCRAVDELVSCFASPVRRAIRKAERSGVSATIVRNRQAIADFYRLHVQTRRRHGLPPQPASFFRNIYEHIVKPGLGFVVIAQQMSRPIAAAIFFASERTLFINIALPIRNFRNSAQIILSCGKASSFWRATARKTYISGALNAKTTVCGDSNFPGGRRKRQLITSELIHRVGSVWLFPL